MCELRLSITTKSPGRSDGARQCPTATFFDAVAERALDAGLCSDEHFSVAPGTRTLIESHASIKSFKPRVEASDDSAPSEGSSGGGSCFKPRNAEVNFRGQKRSNATHRSTTEPAPEGEAVQEGRRPGCEALPHGACVEREPPRPDPRRDGQRSEREGGVHRGAGDARRSAHATAGSAHDRRGPTRGMTAGRGCSNSKSVRSRRTPRCGTDRWVGRAEGRRRTGADRRPPTHGRADA